MLLSIIIPVYNVEKYIRKTLDSTYVQSFPHDEVEIIVVNDGTPDNSMLIVEEFAKCHDNLHIINQENKGLSGARNTGLQVAKGRYVWFVDSDDWIEPNSLPAILKRIENASEDVFVFRIKEYDEQGNLLYERRFKQDTEYTLSGIDSLLDTGFDHVPMQIFIVNKGLYDNNNLRFVEGIQDEDVEFSARMLLKAQTVVFTTIVSYCYLRRTSGNITAGKYLSKKRINSYFYILKKFSEIEKNSIDPKTKRAFLELQRNYILMLYYKVSPEDLNTEGFLSQPLLGNNKSIIRRCVRYRKDIKHFSKDILFLFSTKAYNYYMTKKYIK